MGATSGRPSGARVAKWSRTPGSVRKASRSASESFGTRPVYSLDLPDPIGYPMARASPCPRTALPNPKNPTRSISEAEVERRWYIADAGDQILGRFASRVATVLRGKHKVTYTPHVDGGDFVVVVNARNVRLTGRKMLQKTYQRHTG